LVQGFARRKARRGIPLHAPYDGAQQVSHDGLNVVNIFCGPAIHSQPGDEQSKAFQPIRGAVTPLQALVDRFVESVNRPI
jgi:hypothetical protein